MANMEVSRKLLEVNLIFEHGTRVQEQTLQKILQDNANCEYLIKCGLRKESCNKQLFKELVPLSDYVDIDEYVERIAGGDKSSLLCSYPLLCFSISSGTTAGQSKKFPVTREYESVFEKAQQYMQALVKRASESSAIPALREAGKIFSVSVAGRQFETKGGHKVGSALTNYYRSEGFKKNYDYLKYTSPIEVVLAEDSPQALYCHLLCGLLQASQVWSVEAGFAFNVDAVFTLLRSSWQSLCNDIRNGTLSEEIRDENVRMAVLRLLRPNPELADIVEKECSKTSWEGIVRRLWPNAVFIQCRAGGPLMKPYVSRINHYSGNLPIYGLSYGASEGGHLAICTEPSTASTLFTFLPTTAFYEFIPLNKLQQDQHYVGDEDWNCNFTAATNKEGNIKTVEFEGLQVGRYYQPVVTNFQGLYRYKLGDVIRIAGFNGDSPVCEYVCRNNVILSVNTDKTDEGELQKVMEKASAFLKEKAGIEILEHTTCVEHSCSPGHYVVFVEIEFEMDQANSNDEMGVTMQECCRLLDSSFNHAYKKGRKAGRIGPLELRIVRTGTFDQILKHRLERGANMSQYKPARSIVSPALLEILENGLITTYKSTVASWSVYED